MVKIEDYELVGSYNNQRVTEIDAERSVNLFEYIDTLGKKQKTLIPTSGLDTSHVDFGATTGAFRASFFFNNKTYHVIGTSIWLVDFVGPTLTPFLINPLLPLTTSSGYVAIDANTFQIIFVDGVKGYIYDTTAQTFNEITDSSFPTLPIDVCYLDGFFIVPDGNTNNFQLSMFDQGMVWGAAANNFTTNQAVDGNKLIIGVSTISGPSGTENYATGVPVTVTNSGGALPTTTPQIAVGITYFSIFLDATHIELAVSYADAISGTAIVVNADGSGTQTITSEGQLQQASITTHPGNIVACKTLHRRLFLFSSFYTEVWENQGIGTNLPFRRNNSLLMETGCAAIGSVAVGFDTMIFISQDRDGLGSVMQVNGTESIPISTKALDFTLSTYIATTGISDCRSFFMRENGLIFYRMNFTTSNHTFVYNLSMSDPSQEATRLWHEEEVLNGNRHPAQTHVFYNGINYVGSYLSPILYQTSPNLFTNDGEHIRRMRIGKAYCPPGYQRIRIDRFQIDLLQGSNHSLIFDFAPLLTETGLDEILCENGNFLETNQTLPVHQDLSPRIFFSVSKDGGQTYGNVLTALMGKTGQRTYRTVLRKLGTTVRGQAFVPKVEFFNEVPFVVLGAAWAYEVLPE